MRPSRPLDLDVQVAGRAPEKIVLRIGRDAHKRHGFPVLDPATGAPVDASIRRRIIAEALEAEVRRLQFALYLQLPGLYARKFCLELYAVLLKTGYNVRRNIEKLLTS